MALKEEITTSLKKTSMKGIPRIFSSTSFTLKIIWTMASISLLAICGLSVIYNLIEFLEYNSVVSITEEMLDLHSKHRNLTPEVLICNKNPFSSNITAYKSAGVPLPRDYYEFVNQQLTCLDCNAETEDQLLDLAKRLLLTPRGYYQSVGKENASEISHQEMIVDCKVHVYYSGMVASLPCEGFVHIKKAVLPDFFNCIHIQNKATDDLIVGYAFVLHLDNYEDNPNNYVTSYTVPTRGAGAYISMFPQGTPPMSNPESAAIAPGFDTNIAVKISTRRRLSRPYWEDDCEESFDADGKSPYPHFNYTQDMCISECKIQTAAKECNCTDVSNLNYPEQNFTIDSKLIYCMSFLGQTPNELYARLKCVERELFKGDCTRVCKSPCTRTYYQKWVYPAKWPTKSQLGDFYTNFVVNSPFHEKYKRFATVFEALKAGNSSDISVEQLGAATKLIEDNFAQVSIYLSDSQVLRYVEKPKVTHTGFLSQLGGTLNLWAGITVVLLVEIIDFIFNAVHNFTDLGKKQGTM